MVRVVGHVHTAVAVEGHVRDLPEPVVLPVEAADVEHLAEGDHGTGTGPLDHVSHDLGRSTDAAHRHQQRGARPQKSRSHWRWFPHPKRIRCNSYSMPHGWRTLMG